MITTYNTEVLSARRLKLQSCLNKNNSKRVHQLVKDLTVGPQLSRRGLGNVLLKNKRFSANRQNIAQKLYNPESCGDCTVLDCSQPPGEDLQPILREEVEIAVASLEKWKSAGS